MTDALSTSIDGRFEHFRAYLTNRYPTRIESRHARLESRDGPDSHSCRRERRGALQIVYRPRVRSMHPHVAVCPLQAARLLPPLAGAWALCGGCIARVERWELHVRGREAVNGVAVVKQRHRSHGQLRCPR